MLAAINDISRQAAERQMRASGEHEQQAGDYGQPTQQHQHLADISHRSILEDAPTLGAESTP